MIAIIGAMEIEVEALKNKLVTYEEKEILGVKIIQGKVAIHDQGSSFGGELLDDKLTTRDIILALSGVGKVNAAMTTAILLSNFDIAYVINIGTAGGLLKDAKVLDIVIANQIHQYDFDTVSVDGGTVGLSSYSDKTLVDLCERVLKNEAGNIWIGEIASGDTFISKSDQIESIKKHFPKVIACEMEAGAISQVCNKVGVPCVIIRSLSDNAYHSDSEMDFLSYAKLASERSAKFCIDIVKEL